MNNGLPSLLDAIFGKPNLDTVSLDEIYELISEFPSFNAGHFLLSKKLKEQQESGYEKETMRTALYFNNPFWLESVLNEESHLISGKISPANHPASTSGFSKQDSFNEDAETHISELPVENFVLEPAPRLDDESSSDPTGDARVSLKGIADTEEIPELQPTFQEQPLPEYTDGPVKSFDDLISKYHIASLTTTEESFAESQREAGDQIVEITQSADKTDSPSGSYPVADEEAAASSDDYEIREEVVNEYGIFEEVKVKKTDFDLEAFDKPEINLQEQSTNSGDSVKEESTPVHLSDSEPFLSEKPAESQGGTDTRVEQTESDAIQTRADYEAFDRPINHHTPEETEPAPDLASEEESISEIYSGQDLRLESVVSPFESGDNVNEITASHEQDAGNDQLPDLADDLEEHQKPLTSFDPKKAESIVFAPYHMIDYFASQGIKLVLEENPVDPFAKQLKSFTDWLKVMKKLPAQSLAEKTDDREVDRIRHFAAHSIDEREILTESMAEVLAKQGMHENAIALFQKLSLIYPPKSAYFASRIEQIKASLP